MKAHEPHMRSAVVALMAPPGTHVTAILDALFTACHSRYDGRVYMAEAASMPDLSASSLVRAGTVKALYAARRMAPADIPVHELRIRGGAMLAALSKLEADVFMLGDAAAMRLGARLALWAREQRAGCRWIGIPACPYNSVPFTASSIGFGPALRWSTALCRAVRSARQRDRAAAPIGILDIAGDTTGWLVAGTASLAVLGDHPAFCITPDMAVDAEALCAALGRAVERDGHAVVLTGASARDTAGRPIGASGTTVAQIVRQTIAAHMRLDAVVMQVCPADAIDEAHASARDGKDSRVMARAAVRAARVGESCVMLNRRAPGPPHTLLPHTMPLLDAVSAPRTVSAEYLRPKTYQPRPALRTHLQWCE